jgi:hypothetical protein
MAKVAFNNNTPAPEPTPQIEDSPVSSSPHYNYDHGPKYSADKNNTMNALIGAIKAASELPEMTTPVGAEKYVKLLKLIRGFGVKLSK